MSIFFHTKGLTLEQAEEIGTRLGEEQRAVNWAIGDLARYAKDGLKLGDNYSQVFPEWMSPKLIQNCEAVARAYPREEDRNILATWTIHMREKNRPDRIQRVQAHVDAGRTSDEAAKANREEHNGGENRWLIAFDLHYIAHRHFYSGAGLETAMQVSEWVQRTVERLKAKGATDVICAFDGPNNFRKSLTEGDEWEDHRYKGNRGPKPHDLIQQLKLVREWLIGLGFCCIVMDGYEADDVLCSAATQFPGKTTIVSGDKDLNQTLSDRVNILRDVEWIRDEYSGEMLPDYKWWTAKMLFDETAMTPSQFLESQILSGDSVDSIAGCPGIGEKGAADLVKQFGNVEKVIQAAKDEDESIREKKRQALIEFESKAEITRQLVTLRTDLELPTNTGV